MRRRSGLCAFKFEDICQAPSGKPAIQLNFSKTDQYGSGKVLPLSQKLLDLINKWGILVGGDGCILKSVNRHGCVGSSLNPTSISTILKALQERIGDGEEVRPLSGHLG